MSYCFCTALPWVQSGLTSTPLWNSGRYRSIRMVHVGLSFSSYCGTTLNPAAVSARPTLISGTLSVPASTGWYRSSASRNWRAPMRMSGARRAKVDSSCAMSVRLRRTASWIASVSVAVTRSPLATEEPRSTRVPRHGYARCRRSRRHRARRGAVTHARPAQSLRAFRPALVASVDSRSRPAPHRREVATAPSPARCETTEVLVPVVAAYNAPRRSTEHPAMA